MKIKLDREDIMAAKTIKPGWYKTLIRSIDETKSKGDQSTNYEFKFVITEGNFEGAAVKQWINEKFLAPMVGIIETLSGNTYTEGTEVDLDSMVGKYILIKIINGEYNGRATNVVDGYKAA